MAEAKSPTFLDRLFRVLTVFLALGNLSWFALTFSTYFRWFNTGIMGPGFQLALLWIFMGLPSLICAVVALRRAAGHGGAGILLKLSFLAILGVCACVILFGTFASWMAEAANPARHFPWISWLATGLVSLALAIYALRGNGKAPTRAPEPKLPPKP